MNNARRVASYCIRCDECECTPLDSIHPENKRDRELSQQTVLLINTVCDLRLPISRLPYTICNIIYSLCVVGTPTHKHQRTDRRACAFGCIRACSLSPPTATIWLSISLLMQPHVYILWFLVISFFSSIYVHLSRIRRTTVAWWGLSLQFNQIVLCFDVQILWILNGK